MPSDTVSYRASKKPTKSMRAEAEKALALEHKLAEASRAAMEKGVGPWADEPSTDTDQSLRTPAAKQKAAAMANDDAQKPTARSNGPEEPPQTIRRKRRWLGKFMFVLLVLVPTGLVGWYYGFVAHDQFRSETRFAVRGTNSSPLDLLGFSALPGNTTQAADAYLIKEYIESPQILKDLLDNQGLDVRSFYAKDAADPLFRVDPRIPIEEFFWYWQWFVEADYNSTTSITTFRVKAFASEDAERISQAVLDAAARLVNTLSLEARSQLIDTAQGEVRRTESRLAETRRKTTAFRNREQQLDPTLQARSDQDLITGLQRELLSLRARRAALLQTVSNSSPSVRIIDRQIAALDTQVEQQLSEIGSGTGDASDGNNRNLSDQLGDYNELLLEQEFAEKAYTTALSSLETSQAEARKQERYFAIVVAPTKPEVALFPTSALNTLIAFACFMLLWLATYLIIQSVRDHSA